MHSSSEALKLVDKSWLTLVIIPSCTPSFFVLIFIFSLIDAKSILRWFANTSADHQTVVIIFLFGILLYSIVIIENIYKGFSLFPTASFNKSLAGRFTILVKYFEHFKNYPRRRYGIDSNIFWPRLLLILPSDIRSMIAEQSSNYYLSMIYYMVLRLTASHLSSVFVGVLISFALYDFRKAWWLLALAVWLSFCCLRMSYFPEPKNLRQGSSHVPFLINLSRLVVEPDQLNRHFFIALISFFITQIIICCCLSGVKSFSD